MNCLLKKIEATDRMGCIIKGIAMILRKLFKKVYSE